MKLLPVGSVVLLDGGDKRLMIYGIMQINGADKKQYDYIGCLYPEGYMDAEHTYMFNHKDIVKVDFIGYVDTEFQVFRAKLDEMLGEANKGETSQEQQNETNNQ